MRRILLPGLLALAGFILAPSPAQAQMVGCSSGNCGFGGGHPAFSFGLGCQPWNPFGICFRMFKGLHMEGPLVNYGPYSGYYPFEPYGPWTADLRYTGPIGPMQRANNYGAGVSGGQRRFAGLRDRGCDSCGWRKYAMQSLRNVGRRVNPLTQSCGTCGSTAPAATGCSGCSASANSVESGILTVSGEPIQAVEHTIRER